MNGLIITLLLICASAGNSMGKTYAAPLLNDSTIRQMFDTTFHIPQLSRSRTVRVWLPKDYSHSKKRFPVLYMHDGQNLFDAATSYAGEWGLDEAMDSVNNQWIIVAIDNGTVLRMNEYNPNDHERFGKGEGKAYLDFIVNTLKPAIDKKYRTRKSRNHTAIAGSSMGALISYYAGIWYPGTFGKVGVFSPSFWIAPQIEEHTREAVKRNTHSRQDYFFYGGKQEGKEMVPDMERVHAMLQQLVHPQKKNSFPIIVNENGKHNEAAWRNQLPTFIDWLNKGS